jgi:anti-sigma B factor antagonist
MNAVEPVPTEEYRVARMEGELDLATVGAFAVALRGPSGTPDTSLLVVDLSAVSFMDCSSLNELCAAWRRGEDQGGWTRLVYSHRGITLLLRATNLTDRFPRYATIPDAVHNRSHSGIPRPRSVV